MNFTQNSKLIAEEMYILRKIKLCWCSKLGVNYCVQNQMFYSCHGNLADPGWRHRTLVPGAYSGVNRTRNGTEFGQKSLRCTLLHSTLLPTL